MSTKKQDIIEAAAKADLNPEIASLLRNFFLDLTTREEEEAIDKWLHSHKANDYFFDLLLEINHEGTGAGTIALITQLTQKLPKKVSRTRKIFRITLWAIVLLLVLD